MVNSLPLSPCIDHIGVGGDFKLLAGLLEPYHGHIGEDLCREEVWGRVSSFRHWVNIRPAYASIINQSVCQEA